MAEWKGSISDAQGYKPRGLENIESFQVPNFFVLLPEEVEAVATGDGEVRASTMDAFESLGVSSEVRNAPDTARELVGGQRSSAKASVRLSGGRRDAYPYFLGVSSGNLLDHIETLHESTEDCPEVFVQKMVEPEASLTLEDHGGRQILELVKGLGTSLEEAETTPALYLGRRGELTDMYFPDRQTVIPPGPRPRAEKEFEQPVDRSDIESLLEYISGSGRGLKLAYKRGSFYAVDSYSVEPAQDAICVSGSGIRVAKGRIDGTAGADLKLAEKPVSPENYSQGLFRTGGFTSRPAVSARREGKPAVFSMDEEVKKGAVVTVEPGTADVETGGADASVDRSPQASGNLPVTASKVFSRDEAFSLTDTQDYQVIEALGEFFSNPEKPVINASDMDKDRLIGALEYIDMESGIVILEGPDPEVIEAALRSGFRKFGTSEDLHKLKLAVARQERRIMLDAATGFDS
jgi:hypothetical protein